MRMTMTIDFLAPDRSFIHSYLAPLVSELKAKGLIVRLFERHEDVLQGELLFVLSYLRKVPKSTLALHKHNLVIHASDLPQGKGWSPMPWQIVEGRNEIIFTLFEAAEEIDAVRTYEKLPLRLEGTELFHEWKALQSEMVVKMIRSFLASYPNKEAHEQQGPSSFYRKRNREDDQLDTTQSLERLFDRIRVCDPDHYPAWFELRGRKYKLSVSPL